MVGVNVTHLSQCVCVKGSRPCNRKAGPGDAGYCPYCFSLKGPCPRTGAPPTKVVRAPKAAIKSSRKKVQ